MTARSRPDTGPAACLRLRSSRHACCTLYDRPDFVGGGSWCRYIGGDGVGGIEWEWRQVHGVGGIEWEWRQ
eukprot:325400-Chlamydomonas_euryale.AAC.1